MSLLKPRTAFSSKNLQKRRPWSLVTFLFDHDSWDHYLSNHQLLFLPFVVCSMSYGCLHTVFCYISSGLVFLVTSSPARLRQLILFSICPSACVSLSFLLLSLLHGSLVKWSLFFVSLVTEFNIRRFGVVLPRDFHATKCVLSVQLTCFHAQLSLNVLPRLSPSPAKLHFLLERANQEAIQRY